MNRPARVDRRHLLRILHKRDQLTTALGTIQRRSLVVANRTALVQLHDEQHGWNTHEEHRVLRDPILLEQLLLQRIALVTNPPLSPPTVISSAPSISNSPKGPMNVTSILFLAQTRSV